MKEQGVETNKQLRGKGVAFNRIRRITGYLTGSTSSWGTAKQAEERDRVKHSVSKEGQSK